MECINCGSKLDKQFRVNTFGEMCCISCGITLEQNKIWTEFFNANLKLEVL